MSNSDWHLCMLNGSEYFTRTSQYLVRLKILEWIEFLRRHLHQIHSLRSMVVMHYCFIGSTTERQSRKNKRERVAKWQEKKTACPDLWPFQLPLPPTDFDILLTTFFVSVFPANQKQGGERLNTTQKLMI